jgi:FG-GAP-like repeat/FG-GAP repeat
MSCRFSKPSPAVQSQEAETTASRPEAAPSLPTTPEPPGGWLRDEQGRQYYIDQIPKSRAHRVDRKTVVGRWGFPLDVVREDSQFYYYKVYKPIPMAPPPLKPEPSAEERQKILDSYRVDVKTSERLRFIPFDKGLPKSGQWRQGFAIADMNRDGHPDIILPPPRKAVTPLPMIYLGDGKGDWSLWRDAKFPSLPYDYGDVRVGDFNGDGIPDLAFGVHLRGLIVLLGDGKGGFRNASTGLDFAGDGKTVFSSQALQIMDWNGNGKPDILALAEGPALVGRSLRYPHGVALYLNRGNGRWKRVSGEKRAPRELDDIYGHSIAIGDFDGTGHPGFATGTSVGDRRDLVHLWKPDGGWNTVTVNEIRPMAYVWSVASADFDGDGRADLAVAYSSFELSAWRSGIDIIYSRPGGRWERRPLFVEMGTEGPVALGVGDLVGDGHKDLVALTAKGETLVFLADGKGFFSQEKMPPPVFPGSCKGAHVELADLDGDGKDEIVASFSDEHQASGGCSSDGGVTAWKAQLLTGLPK